jgi:hypothetical protein
MAYDADGIALQDRCPKAIPMGLVVTSGAAAAAHTVGLAVVLLALTGLEHLLPASRAGCRGAVWHGGTPLGVGGCASGAYPCLCRSEGITTSDGILTSGYSASVGWLTDPTPHPRLTSLSALVRYSALSGALPDQRLLSLD